MAKRISTTTSSSAKITSTTKKTTRKGLATTVDAQARHSSFRNPFALQKTIKQTPNTITEAYRQYLIAKKQLTEKQLVLLQQTLIETRNQGDLRENTAYKTCLDDHTKCTQILSEIETHLALSSYTVLSFATDFVDFGATVTLELNNKQCQYTILSPIESDFTMNILAYNSLLAKILLNKKINDTISFPNKFFPFSIDINRGKIEKSNIKTDHSVSLKIVNIQYYDKFDFLYTHKHTELIQSLNALNI